MSKNTFYISYPSIHSGTAKSKIQFFSKTPDLVPVLTPGKSEKKRLFVTDGTVASLECMQSFTSCFDDDVCGNDVLLVLGSGEAYKSIESVLTIIKKAIDFGFSRNDLFVGIGGGVICDLTAFAASIYKRGISVQFVPTTLLAMVDASIGGKTGCDFDNYKNMIGTFYPAANLYYWPEFIQYLPENQYMSGLAEAFKTAILFDSDMYALFRDKSTEIKERDSQVLDEIIKRSVAAKTAVVQKDFTEQNIRATLNLGHTFAHALESVVGLGIITHGEAVAWGIGREIELARKKEYCSQAFRDEIFDLLEKYGWETNAIPSIVKGGGVGERFLTVMHNDKKNKSEKVRLIISKGLCDIITEETEDEDILSVLK